MGGGEEGGGEGRSWGGSEGTEGGRDGRRGRDGTRCLGDYLLHYSYSADLNLHRRSRL